MSGGVKKESSSTTTTTRSPPAMSHRNNPTPPPNSQSQPLPLVVTLNCIEDSTLESDCLSGVAAVEHVSLSRLAEARIESASAVLLHSLAFLPRAAQRRLRPWQLILCLGSSDRSVDSALAADLGLNRLVHVDVSRAEEVADTVMALFLGLLRRTHLLSRHALSASGWLGSVQPLCRGMRRCRGLVLGIVGRSASARSLANRSLAFRMSVLYFDVDEGNGKISRTITFPPAARRMDTLNDLLAASDLISLHCALTNETVQIMNADCLQHVKPGAFLVNTGSSQLLDDCAVKQLLIDGTLAGCALDGADGPQWMEAWVREMPNVLILPRSADYSEEVWLEIREKAVSILQSYFLDGVTPKDSVSDDEEESEIALEHHQLTRGTESGLPSSVSEQLTSDGRLNAENSQKKGSNQMKVSPNQPQGSVSQGSSSRTEAKRSRSSKKTKRRHARQKSQQKLEEQLTHERESSHHEDDTAMSGTEQGLSSNSRFASPEDSRSKRTTVESMPESSPEPLLKTNMDFNRKASELLKDGFIIALYTRDRQQLHVSRQRVKGGAWFLDTVPNVTKRDPAAQFLVVVRSKDTIGLRSFTAGGKLLQINRKTEFVFASHSFDVWESWTFEGSFEECRLVNCRNPMAILDVRIEVLAGVGEDGITRWLD
ncbi:OLC1v1000196C2 [Oldenlandia corymbosa var. corymbosa]|uniref:OLC1v1000196C2 n=1 Tax=Oldenlandia corymbosa var. corymbosa TaxID=529605 RepID=A0AAV1D5U4_OLDCO|nr:OLC1v1000196C2 [Oldenlandia corymbosa var. corymbosa]